jgi:hypothetical protein
MINDSIIQAPCGPVIHAFAMVRWRFIVRGRSIWIFLTRVGWAAVAFDNSNTAGSWTLLFTPWSNLLELMMVRGGSHDDVDVRGFVVGARSFEYLVADTRELVCALAALEERRIGNHRFGWSVHRRLQPSSAPARISLWYALSVLQVSRFKQSRCWIPHIPSPGCPTAKPKLFLSHHRSCLAAHLWSSCQSANISLIIIPLSTIRTLCLSH